jgi:hypothetical protein
MAKKVIRGRIGSRVIFDLGKDNASESAVLTIRSKDPLNTVMAKIRKELQRLKLGKIDLFVHVVGTMINTLISKIVAEIKQLTGKTPKYQLMPLMAK